MPRLVFYMLKKRDKFARDLRAVDAVMHDHPHTWHEYHDDPQKYQKVIEMELEELHRCKAEGDHHCYTENLLHLAAACLVAHHAMTCKEPD